VRGWPLLLVLAGCPADLDHFRVIDAGAADSSPNADGAGPGDGGPPIVDAPPVVDGNGLDPELALPSPDGTPCTTPGNFSECPGIEVCPIATPNGGLCESCSPCGNLNDPCSRSSECDILFQCYQGSCTNLCLLGTKQCGPPEDCLDVGHATHGVCRP
jgi:hypothetical protein